MRLNSATRLVVFFIAALAAMSVARMPAGTWTIDDAAITYSYANSIAAGHGISAYPEGMPTEGYSNPLTLALNVVLSWLGALNPLTTHLYLEILLFALACTLIYSWLDRLTSSQPLAAFAGGLFLALQLLTPATRIWYTSGLENVQLTLAIAFLLVRFHIGYPRRALNCKCL